MNFNNDADLLKAISNKAGGDDMNIEDELDALEAEVNGPKKGKKKKGDNDDLSLSDISDDEEEKKASAKQKEKHESDDDLNNLEKEGLDDVEDEEEKKPVTKVEPKVEQKKPEPQKQQPKKPEANKEELKNLFGMKSPAAAPAPEQKVAKKGEKEDKYPEKPESKYHNVQKMCCLGSLQNEKETCDMIIEYKKKIGEDYDTWDLKKDSIDQRSQMVTATIEDGVWDFDMYKKKIQEQLVWETKLMQFCEKDPTLKDYQKKAMKERIGKRCEIIKEELTRQIEDDEGDEGEGNEEEKKEEVKKEEPKAEIKKEEPKNIKKENIPKTDTQNSVLAVIEVPKEKEKEEIKRLTQIVTDRLNEYRAALDYFKANDLAEQQGPAIQSAKQICIELKKIQDGHWKEVNEFKLPDPITPQYIFGYSVEERKQKFAKIISEMSKQKKAVQDEMDTKVEAFKKLSKAQFQKIKNVAGKDMDALKAKRDKYDKVISLLKLKFQDKWVPAPLFMESQEDVRVEKTNKDIPEFTVRVITGKTDYLKDKVNLNVKLVDTKLFDDYEQKAKGDWTHTIDWKLDKADFRGFFKKKIRIEIYEKKFLLGARLKGTCEIEPRQLKDHCEYTNKFKIELVSKRFEPTVEVTFKLRQPCHDPEYETIQKTEFHVTKIYPPFKGDSKEVAIKLDVPNTIQAPKVTAEDLKVSSTNSNNSSKPPANPRASAKKAGGGAKPAPGGGEQQKKMPAAKGPAIDKSQFKDEELKDPDNIDCLNTLQVLEFKQKKYEAIREKIDGRTPRELMQRIVKIKCKINVINDALGDTIGAEDYLGILKTTFSHDKLLSEYFVQQKDQEKYKLVSERLPLLVKETEELVKQMKSA